MTFSSAQCRAARALIDMTQRDLAKAASVGISTIRSFEADRHPNTNNLKPIQYALETAGVIFVAENGGGAGVRLRKSPNSAAELTRRIDVLEDDLAKTKGQSPQTPQGGMQTLERAHMRNVVTKLQNWRTKLRGKR